VTLRTALYHLVAGKCELQSGHCELWLLRTWERELLCGWWSRKGNCFIFYRGYEFADRYERENELALRKALEGIGIRLEDLYIGGDITDRVNILHMVAAKGRPLYDAMAERRCYRSVGKRGEFTCQITHRHYEFADSDSSEVGFARFSLFASGY
jgi:hypothetical protein